MARASAKFENKSDRKKYGFYRDQTKVACPEHEDLACKQIGADWRAVRDQQTSKKARSEQAARVFDERTLGQIQITYLIIMHSICAHTHACP